jgi:para-aminobenzoate synthetase component 1
MHMGFGAGHLAFGWEQGADHWPGRHAQEGGFGAYHWWTPEAWIHMKHGKAVLFAEANELEAAKKVLAQLLSTPNIPVLPRSIHWSCDTSRDAYLAHVTRLKDHIQRGDIYEVNYCIRRQARVPDLDPFDAFGALLRHTDAPFASLYRLGDHFAMGMSPERFLRVEGDRVVTQPMKGTIRRSADPQEDAALAIALATSAKERSENIMAVDVARNDLSRVAASRSVHVDELCHVQPYGAVHQMVSTVSARLRPGLVPWDAVRATFPMASMTGAPKLRALQLIDEAEDQARGIYSGAMGFQLPDGTLDLHVVIRTITYNAATGEAALMTGSAITALSDPAMEWAECELKANSILNALRHAG